MEENYTKGDVEILTRLDRVESVLARIAQDIANHVTRNEFDLRVKPLERVVYGMVSLMLVAILVGMLTLVVK